MDNRKNQEVTTSFGEVMRNTGIKILRYDSNGFILASKRLLEDMNFQWPRTSDEVYVGQKVLLG